MSHPPHSITRIVETAGAVEDRAATQGATLHRVLPRMIDALRAVPFAPPWMPAPLQRAFLSGGLRALGRCYLRWHEPFLDRQDGGRHLRALSAAASAAGVSTSRLYGLNAIEIESSNFGFSLGCTSIALGGDQTSSGHARLGYNHDFPPSLRGFVTLRRSRPTDAFASLSLTYAPLLGAVAGINDRGLAITLNHAFATDIRRRTPGLFLTLLVQDCLDRCRTVAEAARKIRATPVPSGGILTLVDARGERRAIELSVTRSLERHAEATSVMSSFNLYRDVSMAKVEIPLGARATGAFAGYDIHACNVSRSRRFEEIVTHDARHTDADLIELLSDHDGGDGDSLSICRHRDPLSETLFSVVFQPEERSLSLRFGPCGGEFERFAVEAGAYTAEAAY